ncbi:MAG TPA: tyrosine-type recombinase/integrase, partial [Chloroflexota bacterium]|nr:tyrosine-type recombinase/integrase [Chloroflexota bacterium]
MTEEQAKPKRKRTTKRRGRGEDSVYQRASDGRWIVEIRDGYKPSGKPKIIYLTAKTKALAMDKRRKVHEQMARGVPIGTEKQTVATYLDYWLQHKVRPSKRTGTYDAYVSLCRVHIIPALGHRQLAKLTAQDVQAMLSTMVDNGVSPTTAKNARAVLRKALNDAIREDLLWRNVVTQTDMPAQRTYHAKPLTAEELPRFLAAAKGHRLEALFLLLPSIGLRAGEAYGLRWSDVDLDRGQLAVKMQMQRAGKPKRPHFADTKTERSRRPVPLPPQMVRSLREHRARQLEEIELAGGRWQGEQWEHLVFCTTIGTPLDPSKIMAEYRAVLTAAGIDPDRRIHDLRHTCATMLAQLGVQPREAQEILRHSRIQTTLAVYTHVSSEGVRSAVGRLSDMLGTGREDEGQ